MPNPRPLQMRELRLISMYSNWELGMTPQEFYFKWAVSYEQIALICSRSDSTVRGWFRNGRNRRYPTHNDLRHLALMNFLLEHFEEIPEHLVQHLCLNNSDEYTI
ncbi:hypothetical protein [Nostoc sp.]